MKICQISASQPVVNNNLHKGGSSENNNCFQKSFAGFPIDKEGPIEKRLPGFIKRFLARVDDWQNRVDREVMERASSQTEEEAEEAHAAENALKRIDYT